MSPSVDGSAAAAAVELDIRAAGEGWGAVKEDFRFSRYFESPQCSVVVCNLYISRFVNMCL